MLTSHAPVVVGLFILTSQGVSAAAPLPPVVIVPGDGSNILEAKLNKPSVRHWYCSKSSDWYRLWLNTANLLSTTSCWADNIRLEVDATTGRASNAPGVETRVPFWGSTEGLEELDPQIPGHATATFYQMVRALVAAGYVRNVSLRGAPYDFRYTPDSSGLVPRLRTLVEQAVATAAGRPATLVSHSMGGLQTLYFLRQQTAAWKARHIARWVSISTPFAGSAQLARLFATGDSEGLPVAPSLVRDEQRSYESNHWLYPTAYVGSPWRGFPLVRTDAANYTVSKGVTNLLHNCGPGSGPQVLALAPGLGPGLWPWPWL